jgi:inner membrane protein
MDPSRYFFEWRPLRTSPLGVTAFFSARGVAILANEAVYVVGPALLAAALTLSLRRLKDRSGDR